MMRVTRGSGIAGLAGIAEASWTSLGTFLHLELSAVGAQTDWSADIRDDKKVACHFAPFVKQRPG